MGCSLEIVFFGAVITVFFVWIQYVAWRYSVFIIQRGCCVIIIISSKLSHLHIYSTTTLLINLRIFLDNIINKSTHYYYYSHPVCFATNAHTSPYSSITFSVGFPAPCPALTSIRINIGRSFLGDTSRCMAAANL